MKFSDEVSDDTADDESDFTFDSRSDFEDDLDDFLSSFELNGQWMGGSFTFTQASQGSILLSESVDYEITLTYYTWEFENIREISEI